eukprot:2231578-Amphidinium_carterae.1
MILRRMNSGGYFPLTLPHSSPHYLSKMFQNCWPHFLGLAHPPNIALLNLREHEQEQCVHRNASSTPDKAETTKASGPVFPACFGANV